MVVTAEPAASPLADEIVDWFGHAARDLPWRRPGFSAWGTLVSEIMLQQTQVSRVIPRLAEWLDVWPTPAALAAAPTADVLRAWGGLGYPRRALNLQRAAAAIVDRHGGEVPRDVDLLLALPGIGDYTARAVAVFAFGDRHPVVDTNVRRVIARAVDGLPEAGAPGRRDLAAMAALLPDDRDRAAAFNAGAMELGAIVCTARAPDCDACPVAHRCAWRAAGYPPPIGPARRKQARFEGSDRQLRGRMLRLLRAAVDPVPVAELIACADDAARGERVLAGLAADGLAVVESRGARLP